MMRALGTVSTKITTGLVSILLALLLLEGGVRLAGWGAHTSPSAWTYALTEYSPDYIYWERSYCDKNLGSCTYPEEHILNYPVEVRPAPGTPDCRNPVTILFLGDSFTDAPWVDPAESYASVFSRRIGSYENRCVRTFRLSAGGAGNDQEYARASDVLAKLRPDIVIWQFYFNDLYENITNSLYAVRNSRLVRQKAWSNHVFLSGYANQHIPLFQHSAVGKLISYELEEHDMFRTETPHNFYGYNAQKIRLFLAGMNQLSRRYGFSWFTTVAPLECTVVPGLPCPPDDSSMDTFLTGLLRTDSAFLSMTGTGPENDRFKDATAAQALFNTTEDSGTPGERHLSRTGNSVFGNVLGENYLKLRDSPEIHY